MNPDLLVPALLGGAVLLFLLVRKSSELPRPKLPEMPAHRMPPTADLKDAVLITHPLIRRAAEKALEEGGDAVARYIRKEGDRVYFTFGAIKDPVERQKAIETIANIEEGGDVSITEAIQLLRRLLRGK